MYQGSKLGYLQVKIQLFLLSAKLSLTKEEENNLGRFT